MPNKKQPFNKEKAICILIRAGEKEKASASLSSFS
jgi:hypothetical protein